MRVARALLVCGISLLPASASAAPSLMVGARIGTLSSHGSLTGGNGSMRDTDELFTSRYRVEVDVGARLNPHWSAYAFYDRGVLRALDDAPEAWTASYGVGIDHDALPDSPVSLVVDLGFGVRQTSVWSRERPGGLFRQSNPETLMPVRLGIGPRYLVGHFRVDLLFTFDHAFYYVGGTCPDGCEAWYGFYGITLAGRGWL